jgi:hypothetical protein
LGWRRYPFVCGDLHQSSGEDQTAAGGILALAGSSAAGLFRVFQALANVMGMPGERSAGPFSFDAEAPHRDHGQRQGFTVPPNWIAYAMGATGWRSL